MNWWSRLSDELMNCINTKWCQRKLPATGTVVQLQNSLYVRGEQKCINFIVLCLGEEESITTSTQHQLYIYSLLFVRFHLAKLTERTELHWLYEFLTNSYRCRPFSCFNTAEHPFCRGSWRRARQNPNSIILLCWWCYPFRNCPILTNFFHFYRPIPLQMKDNRPNLSYNISKRSSYPWEPPHVCIFSYTMSNGRCRCTGTAVLRWATGIVGLGNGVIHIYRWTFGMMKWWKGEWWSGWMMKWWSGWMMKWWNDEMVEWWNDEMMQ